ncbi:FabD/lysophospholipase-like protein, partial [Lepidopterella palustris CBS 459.81]
VDGGGARGLSTLYILKFIMQGLEDAEEPCVPRPLRPCNYFDLIAGTSSGGLIAIMLGVFQMTIQQCIEKWEKLAPDIFPKKT